MRATADRHGPSHRSAPSRAGRGKRASSPPGVLRASGLAILALTALLTLQALEGARARAATRVPLPLPHHQVVRQSHPRGCAAALLATLLARRGLEGSEAALLAAVPPGPRGIDLADFARLAASHGLPGHWYRSAAQRLPRTPFVAHLDRPDGHFVWVSDRAGDYLRVSDPASGEAVWHVATFAARFSGRFYRIEGEGAS